MPLAEFNSSFPSLCSRLLRTKVNDRVGHAYLLTGDEIDFLERFAQAWAQVCVCTAPHSDGDACGVCRMCHLLEADSYPAYFELRPQSKSRRIVIDEVRAFERQVSLAAGRDRLKIGVIVEADRMGVEAQNAFLKTLEEPPPGTMLLMLSAQPRMLLPTIRSRCQALSLLRNQRDYGPVIGMGLIPILAGLRRRAGPAVALAAAARLGSILSTLHDQAEATLAGDQDERWESVAENDKALSKRLAEEQNAKVEAEYVRLRQEVGDAIHAWFQQQVLVAAGAEPRLLPHLELIAAAEQGTPAAPLEFAEADRAVRLSTDLLKFLRSNVRERLAVEAFCLELTRE